MCRLCGRLVEAEPSPASAALAPVASHDAGPGGAIAGAPEQDGGACMVNAKPANYDFKLKDLDGKEVSLASFKGKTVLLNFWATWCGPCKAEIPGFVELQAKYRDKLTIIGYSVDDDAPKARAFAQDTRSITRFSWARDARTCRTPTGRCGAFPPRF